MKTVRRISLLFLIYLLVAVPFKVMEIIPGFTDIRPVTMLGPIFAIFYGVPGCCVMAVGNLVMDAVSDSLRWSSIPGFAANFLGPFLIYLFWIRWSRVPFSLRNGKSLLKPCMIVCLSAVLEMVLITPAVALVYPSVDAKLFALTVLVNTAAFPIVFGIPVMILMQEELGACPVVRKTQRYSPRQSR